MNRSEFYRQLRIRRDTLIKELESIDVLLADDDSNFTSENKKTIYKGQPTSVVKHSENTDYLQKGILGWEEYVTAILKAIGSKVKSSDIIAYMIDANPRIDPERITDAVRSVCSKLAKSGNFLVERAGAKSEGYYYWINPEKSMEVAA